MKNYILIISVVFFAFKGWSQNQNIDYKYAIKVYNLTSYNVINDDEYSPFYNNYHNENNLSNYTF